MRRTDDIAASASVAAGGRSPAVARAERELPTASPGPSAQAPGHLAHLDGLRGVAILAVLAVHASQHVAGLAEPIRDLTFYGVRGVQLFFVVSGLTLTVAHAGRPLELPNFAARRFFRIAPMFYAGVVLYLLLSRFTAMPLSTRDAGPWEVAATLLFVHGWVPSAVNTVVPGGWSIAAEAMFYLIFPLALALAPRPRLLGAAVGASYVVAGLANIVLKKVIGGPVGDALAFPFWLVQLPAFLGGCWLASLPAPGLRVRRLARWALVALALAMLADSQARGRSNLLVAVALLTAFTWAAGAARPRWLEWAPLVFLGRISFSFYIVHFAVLGALHPLASRAEGLFGATLAFTLNFALTLSATAPIAACTFRWFEQPIIAATRRFGRRASA